MEMQQLRYVVAIAKTGSFSRAAAQCHVAQPSLSQQIRKLEEELGERLFDRLKREVKLTPAGEIFLRRAALILAEAEEARREVQDAGRLLRGEVTLGVLPTIAPYLLPPVMAEFFAAFPGVKMLVQEDTTDRLLRRVQAYEIDFALLSGPVNDERLEVQELFAEALLLALPPGHALVRKKAVILGDLEHEKLIVMKQGHCLGDQVLGFCDRAEARPEISFRSAQLETIQALVQAGLGISLIPEMAAQRPAESGPVYRELTALRPERTILAVWPKQRAPRRAAAEFLRMTAAWFAERQAAKKPAR